MNIFWVFLIGLVTYVLVDMVWLGFVMKDTYQNMLAAYLRYVNGVFTPLWLPGILVWILLVIGLLLLVVLPFHTAPFRIYLLKAALYGLVVYGVYGLTNAAIVAKWPLTLVIYDIAWGMILNIIVATVLYYAMRY